MAADKRVNAMIEDGRDDVGAGGGDMMLSGQEERRITLQRGKRKEKKIYARTMV